MKYEHICVRNEDGFYGSHGSKRVWKSKSDKVEVSNINWTVTVYENGELKYQPNSRTRGLDLKPVIRVTQDVH